MNLRQKITEDMKSAMRAGDVKRRDAIRLLQAALKQKEVDERVELDDVAVITVIEKMLKQRRDSITQYEAAERQDLADIEKFEVEVLQVYMPKALSDVELDAVITEAIASIGESGSLKIGEIMALLKPKLAGKADMGKVSQFVKEKIS
ncbi:GatB/YqeY domain-containing protein [Betaproteobacteria bacterium PRO4]|uniref:GatB/YqeY domain-containing protein n=1 Tax=Nitrosomonas sp. TaxID=42353 RepID=UPI00256020AB|nr:GatB/YqeY domain-containing protein [Nitrosomonas sp.]MBE7527196.1 GatB/YqeY domain-containing protein [Burkholderiales bacterium]MDL1866229.1 GatB/YqeY domain-containing protein [Betaproteobacteria bacterium PRO4]